MTVCQIVTAPVLFQLWYFSFSCIYSCQFSNFSVTVNFFSY